MPDDADAGFFRNLSGLATEYVRQKRRSLAAGDPETNVDSTGGGHRYTFGGQELSFEDLRDIKDIRDSGGQVAQLMDYKALLNFGEGAEVHVEDNEATTEVVDGEELTLEEWLEEIAFPKLDLTVLDLGGDALWYPAAVGEIQETVTGDFKRALPAEPWTIIPITNDHGEVEAYRQRTKAPAGGYTEQTLPAEDLWHIVVNKSSARDQTGISEVLRNKDEIRAFKENESAINQAIELHGFPQRHVKVGREEGAPVSDDDLRRVRGVFDPRSTDANTAYFTGQDVDVETLEAHQFDYSAIHEMDMRNLTTALGLPLEAGNVGADGLGSGKPAELRFALLKLAIKANQRSFSVQFVERVMRPVIRDYSPFDHNATITLDIADPLEDIGEVAELINSIGDYMTNNEIRRKLDLPEPEDEEIGEGYRSPADIEAPEDEGGPFGGGDGLFRDAADGRTLAEVPDNAVSISDRSEAPDGAQIITGPGGGLYYVPRADGDGGDNDRPGSDVDFDSVEETAMPLVGGSAPRLSESERKKVWGVIEDVAGEGSDQLQEIQMGAKEKSYSAEGQTRERAFLRAAGVDLDIRNGDIDGEAPSEELIKAAGAFREASQKAFAEIQGKKAEVYRGLSDEATEGLLIDAIATGGEGVSIDTFGMTNFTTEREVADRFGSDSATISTEVSADEVLSYTDALMDTQQEGEVSIEGGKRKLSVNDVGVGILGRSFNLSEQLEDPHPAFLSRLEDIDNPDVQEFVEAHQ